MATIVINEFFVEIPGANQLRFRVSFTLNQTATEARLSVPSHIWVKLMQKKGPQIDALSLYADKSTTLDADEESITSVPGGGTGTRPPIASTPSIRDIQVGDWEYAGLYDSSGTNSFSFTRNTVDLPSDSNTEEWYVVAIARPDVPSSVAYSIVIPVNI